MDATLALLSEGYAFIPNRCRHYGSDVFAARLMLSRVVCMSGREAAEQFYDRHRFTRRHALPRTSFALIQDHGSVMVMDGEAHRHRKAMFLSLVGPDALRRLADLFTRHWQEAVTRWAGQESSVLLDEAHRVITAAVCEWVGLPLDGREVDARAAEFAAMIAGTGAIGPRNWGGHLLRARTERWARRVIEETRAGRRAVPEGAARTIATYRDGQGQLLDVRTAGVELINILRPTVANARYIVFAAMALHDHPQWAEALRRGDDSTLDRFAWEVRRVFPFIPFIGGRVREPFAWRGHDFKAGDWVLMDLYGTNHDPRLWHAPERFDPDRYRLRGEAIEAFNLISHGGGSAPDGHRCPGEGITQTLLVTAARLLTASMRYDVPQQDLTIDLSNIPARPRSGFVVSNVRPT
ncbi:cytochrome P450 [Methylobacterium gnaphalii]|uniref:Fatty-acid peroxygenase n=1 Tax=Methylobacterium gnaphalii TaxID=1010610 RepID=A0A512JHX6_9HYPH|nr:cytochrome P450 [Methylobacterium gnaphalii]GEP09536.1 fatty-acid peroxygenase [Methylobacterium gnaphalii]GLS48166.1 fatty-acid peroxygenase [Methylobacterium gnaphalii]